MIEVIRKTTGFRAETGWGNSTVQIDVHIGISLDLLTIAKIWNIAHPHWLICYPWTLVLVCPVFSGFSFVDLVEGAKDGRFYALKKILCHDREGRQEAQTEVEMHQTFNHPNILNLVAHTFVDRGGKSEAWLLLPYMRVSWGVCPK